MIDGDQLTVKLANGDISVQASRNLLRKVFAICDGTRSVDELMESIMNVEERDLLRRFIGFLLESGALIDASHYFLAATHYAWGNNPFGQAAPPIQTARIGKRFELAPGEFTTQNIYRVDSAPLWKQFSGRVSTYTFDDRAVTLNGLNTLLWSLGGIVDQGRQHQGMIMPRRTIPSAGAMHLLAIYVVLQRQPDGATGESLQPGVYRVRFPGEGMLQYEHVNADISLLPRAVAKPGSLSFSSGMIFLAADAQLAGMRYRNRSVQYLFTEAGMALQNGALTASDLGIGFVAFGSYYEAIVRAMCNLSDELILGSAIFGTLPTPEQQQQLSTCPPIDFAWADAPSQNFSLPYFVGRSKLKDGSSDHPTWGRDTDPALAWRKAIAETIERMGYQEPRGLQTAAFTDLPDALDPRLVARFSERQYKAAGFPFKRFSPDEPALWANGQEYGTGKKVSVLADLVYAAQSLQQAYGQQSFYWQSNSSGCAAGTTAASAQLAATLELIERDAFMRHWLAQSPGIGINADSLPEWLKKRMQSLCDTGFEVVLQVLPSQWAPVVFAFARHPGYRSSCVSAGSRLTLEHAIDSALVELESRVFNLLNGFHTRKLTPKQVSSPDDHFSLYAQARYFDRADRLYQCEKHTSFEQASNRNVKDAQTLFDDMVAHEVRLTFVDIAPRLNGIRDGRERLAVVRALAPGLVPMSFGYRREPLGMVKNVHPAALFPHPFP